MLRSFKKAILIVILSAFIGSSMGLPFYAQAAVALPWMPAPGVMLHLSPEFIPAHLIGMTVHQDNALQFDFLIHRGDHALPETQKKSEYSKLVRYFLASLTIPEEDQWVNLSPYENNRIIKEDFGKTEMGRDLLAQDYILKQITSSLIYPEDHLGKKFWDRVYERAYKEFGVTNVPVNTFNKVWIIPDQAAVYESGNTVYVLRNHLKVMLEEDYLALSRRSQGVHSITYDKSHAIASQVIREIILPELEREVNEGKNFANLRQIYSGMILATWYKHALKESLLAKIYANRAKVLGVTGFNRTDMRFIAGEAKQSQEQIYQQYLKAFKVGAFNYIKDDIDRYTKERIPRKYFSGGARTYRGVTEGFGNRAALAILESKDLSNIPAELRGEIVDEAILANSKIDRASISLTVSQAVQSLPTDQAAPAMYDYDTVQREPRSALTIFLNQSIPWEEGKKFSEKYTPELLNKLRQGLPYKSSVSIEQIIAYEVRNAHFSFDFDEFLSKDIDEAPPVLRPILADMIKFSELAYQDNERAPEARMFLWKLGEEAFNCEVEIFSESSFQYNFPFINELPGDKDKYILDLAGGPRAANYFPRSKNEKIIVVDISYFVEGYLNQAKRHFNANNIIIRRADARQLNKYLLEDSYRHIRLGNINSYMGHALGREFYETLMNKLDLGGTISDEFYTGGGDIYYEPTYRMKQVFKEHPHSWGWTKGVSLRDELSGGKIHYYVFRRFGKVSGFNEVEKRLQDDLYPQMLSLLKNVDPFKQAAFRREFEKIRSLDQFTGFSQFFYRVGSPALKSYLLAHKNPSLKTVQIADIVVDSQYVALTIELLNALAHQVKAMRLSTISVAVVNSNGIRPSMEILAKLGFRLKLRENQKLYMEISADDLIKKLNPAMISSQRSLAGDKATLVKYDSQLIKEDKRSAMEIFLGQGIPGEQERTFGDKYPLATLQAMRTELGYGPAISIDQIIAKQILMAHFSHSFDSFLENDITKVPQILRPIVADVIKFSQVAYREDKVSSDARMFLWKLGQEAFDIDIVEEPPWLYQMDFPFIDRISKNEQNYILDLAAGPRAARYFQKRGQEKIIVVDISYFVEGFLNQAKEHFKATGIIIRRANARNLNEFLLEKQYRHIRLGNFNRYVGYDLGRPFYESLMSKIEMGGTISNEYYNSFQDLPEAADMIFRSMSDNQGAWFYNYGTSQEYELSGGEVRYFLFTKNGQVLDLNGITDKLHDHLYLQMLDLLTKPKNVEYSSMMKGVAHALKLDAASGLSQFFYDNENSTIKAYLLAYPDTASDAVQITHLVTAPRSESALPSLLRDFAHKVKELKINVIRVPFVNLYKSRPPIEELERYGFHLVIGKEGYLYFEVTTDDLIKNLTPAMTALESMQEELAKPGNYFNLVEFIAKNGLKVAKIPDGQDFDSRSLEGKRIIGLNGKIIKKSDVINQVQDKKAVVVIFQTEGKKTKQAAQALTKIALLIPAIDLSHRHLIARNYFANFIKREKPYMPSLEMQYFLNELGLKMIRISYFDKIQRENYKIIQEDGQITEHPRVVTDKIINGSTQKYMAIVPVDFKTEDDLENYLGDMDQQRLLMHGSRHRFTQQVARLDPLAEALIGTIIFFKSSQTMTFPIQKKAKPADKAMGYGGIDFNAAHMRLLIKRDGRGVPLPLNQQDLAQLSQIQGFVPIIISIKSALNLPILSELRQKLHFMAS